uniref:AT1G17665-like protein n=1 Tax=Francoa sonchifolia TaxID=23250 RepID=A0A0G4AQ08_9ROSI|nr:AT1G17665-like protein [Francoa sonchifolia]
MFSLFIFFALSLISFFFASFSIHRRLYRCKPREANPIEESILAKSLSGIVKETLETDENSATRLRQSVLVEILAADSNALDGSGLSEDQKGKKKRKKTKKKRGNLEGEDGGGEERGNKVGLKLGSGDKQELVCLYPFTSSSSATQRKIKQQYDQLVKCNDSKGLTLAQVGQFANCLIEARTELQHKSEVTKRKFTITKALLFKADKSSVDRLRQQIYKLELEQKRLEEDAFVYNWLQQQLKLSPAYKKMLEIGVGMELKAKAGELMETTTDDEFTDISFEELLAQEKKDSFWQKNGKSRTCSNY